MEYEASSSFCYNFARYEIHPRVEQRPDVQSGSIFNMTAVTQEIMDELLTKAQQEAKFKAKKSDKMYAVGQDIKFWASYVAKNSDTAFVALGGGMFRLKTAEDFSEDDLEEAALEEGDEELAEGDGWIYAFSFPEIAKGGVFPIKIGKTLSDADDRVIAQCKGSWVFSSPIVLGKWKVKRVGPTEYAIHNILKARGKWRENAPGQEWFDTTINEIEAILAFIVQ